MISVNSPEPESNFWQELVTKVQEIGQRTRDQSIMPHIPSQKSIRKHKYSRFEVQEVWHRSQEEAQSLANRIKYIEIDKERHNRTLDLAKKKYERMVEIRERSLREKQEFKKRIAQMNVELSKQAAERVMKMREERSRTSHSVHRVRQKNGLEAKEIRELSDEFEEAMRQEREMEVEQKRMQVERTKEMMEKQRIRLGRIQQERIKLGKLEHKELIRRQLVINLQQHRRNSILRNKLEQSITIANNSKQEKLNLLQEYQTLMAPHSSRARQISAHRSD